MIAFVLAGAGSLGSIEVGMLEALMTSGIQPDLLAAASAGSLNAAWVAGHPEPERLSELTSIWGGISRGQVFPVRPWTILLGLVGRRSYLVPSKGLAAVIHRHLPFSRLEQARVPLHLVATSVTSGEELVLSSGDAASALLASAAIPGLYPPVQREGVWLMDGGITDNTPISVAADLGANTVYVLPAGYSCALSAPPRGAVAMGLHALGILIQERLRLDIARHESRLDLRVVPPLCPLPVSASDFSHSADLIARARASTAAWLEQGKPAAGQAGLLAIHSH